MVKLRAFGLKVAAAAQQVPHLVLILAAFATLHGTDVVNFLSGTGHVDAAHFAMKLFVDAIFVAGLLKQAETLKSKGELAAAASVASIAGPPPAPPGASAAAGFVIGFGLAAAAIACQSCLSPGQVQDAKTAQIVVNQGLVLSEEACALASALDPNALPTSVQVTCKVAGAADQVVELPWPAWLATINAGKDAGGQ
jgi:hypothetical protein